MAIDRVKVLKQADAHMANGKIDKAIEDFKKLLDDTPNDYNLMNRIGDACLQIQRQSEAMEMFRRAGLGLEKGGFTNKAAAVYKKAHRAAPEDPEIATRLAECYRSANMLKDAIQVHMEMADFFTKKGLLKKALEEFAKVVELDPKNLKNKIKLADFYNKEGMKDRAAEVYLEVAESLAFDQMHSEASQVLERAKTMISAPKVFLTQSRLAIVQKDLASAAKHLREGLQVNHGSSELLEALAEVEIQAKAPERALEALNKIPQLPEKATLLCERALREMVKTSRAEEGLNIFKGIGRELTRRGMGDQAIRILHNAFQGEPLPMEAWLQLAEFAQQTGNRETRLDALSHAHVLAITNKDGALQRHIEQQFQEMGIAPNQIQEPSSSAPIHMTDIPNMESTEVDPLKKIQLQKLEKEADAFLKGRFSEKALEAYGQILELAPSHRIAIARIADILKASGVMTKVQQHYVRVAEKLVLVGKQHMAAEMLDEADAIIPGSTRMHRKMLGLVNLPPPPQSQPATEALPAMGAPVQPAAAMPEAPYPSIALDQTQASIPVPLPVAPPPPPAQAQTPPPPLPPAPLPVAAKGPLTAPLPPITVPTPVEPALEAMQPIDELDEAAHPHHALSLPGHLLVNPPTPPTNLEEEDHFDQLDSLESLNSLPGLPEKMQPVPPLAVHAPAFANGKAAPPPPAQPPAQLPAQPASPALPVEVDEELANMLSDIDFQLDYGSPEEARGEIYNALQTWPQHPELLRRLENAEDALRRLGHHEAPASLEEDRDFTNSFFDLTAVLGNSIVEGEEMHDATNVVEKIHSIDELFNAFREGVEQQVKGDDYETHYNLGIAYKEMLLIEPAIEEFKKALCDPERTLECCSMLAICEQAQNNLQAAEAWLRQGINTPGFPPEDTIGLRYDLGEILMSMGRASEAQALFKSVQAMNPEYREVGSRV